jgi:NAD(P)-dependent dehydrogenase (short-subunit alcohol dehydrogenase family)
VVATSRRTEGLSDFTGDDRGLVLALDVMDAPAREVVVAEAAERFARIDVLVNNAGRTQVGAIEETVGTTRAYVRDNHRLQPGDPVKAAEATIKALDSATAALGPARPHLA